MKNQNTFGPLEIASLFLVAGLLICLCKMPYGYYTIIRLFTAVMGVVWAITFYGEHKKGLMTAAIAVAILFQPIVKITMDKATWNVIDVILSIGIVALVIVRQFERNKQKQGNK